MGPSSMQKKHRRILLTQRKLTGWTAYLPDHQWVKSRDPTPLHKRRSRHLTPVASEVRERAVEPFSDATSGD